MSAAEELITHLEVLKLEPGDRLAISHDRLSQFEMDLLRETVTELADKWGIEVLVLGPGSHLTVVRE